MLYSPGSTITSLALWYLQRRM
uniref:Uncharacterized protein n=1 Tax=Arundo donax TaxID=35708 RepID=A0A0A9B5G8_ARUDO